MIELSKPVRINDREYTAVDFRALTAGDVIQAREAAEKIFFVQTETGPVPYPGQSQNKLDIELLRRQLKIGGVSPVPLHIIENMPVEDLLTIESAANTIEKKNTQKDE